jgi:hypothetical protein
VTTGQGKILSDIVKRLQNSEAEPLRALIDEYLMKRGSAPKRYTGHPINMNEKPRPPGRLSPSSVYTCERQAVLRFAGVEGTQRFDPDQQLLFEDGHWRHHKWQFMFYDMECVLGRDRFRVVAIERHIVIPEYYVAGSLDAEIAIRMPSGKWRFYIVDFKGVNDRGYQWIARELKPKEDNRRQLLLYMKARNRKRGILLYDNKDKNTPRTFTVDFSGELWEETLNWIDRVIDKMRHKRLPGRDVACRPGTMMYENCMFRKPCWSKKVSDADLRDLTYARSRWRGIDAMWEAGLKEWIT